ncbi:MAG: helix-turn-helix transcriptional regulator [Alphaproteobacteria bacterium]|nr:helix-turn-helix transcriptional regulator [Alphaproteobacteria bacterium]
MCLCASKGTVSHISNECVAFKHLNFDLDRSWEFAYGFCDEHVRSDNVIIYDVGHFLANGVQAGQIVSFKGLPYLYKPTKYGGLDLSIKNISKIRFHEQKDETSNLDIARRELEDLYCNELCLFTDHCYRNGICLAAEGAFEGFVELMTAMTVKEDNVVNPYSVADNIKFYRKINKIKQSELADKMFVTQQEVSKWELGKSLPDTAQCAEMARIFKVPVSNIILSSSITKEVDIDYTEIWDDNIAYLKNRRGSSDFYKHCYDEAVRKKHIAFGGNVHRCLKLSDSEYDALLQFKTMNPNGTELDFWKAYFPSDFEATTSIHSIIENAKRTYRYANVSQQKPSATHLLK